MVRGLVLAALLAWLPCLAQAAECGEQACAVPLGTYHAALPERAFGPEGTSGPVVLFFHGYGQSGAEVLRNPALVDPILRRGYVLLAPDGLPRAGRTERGWGGVPRDLPAFATQVLDDAGRRFRLDRRRVLVAGFSAGGGAAWDLACHAAREFAAFAPVAGGFRRRLPDDCQGPVKLLHTHGWQDLAVPLEGAPPDRDRQPTDIFHALQRRALLDGCPESRATAFTTGPLYWTRRWTDCAPGAALQMILHPGHHEIPPWWPDLALDWFEEVTGRR